jgi:hypothetical protein
LDKYATLFDYFRQCPYLKNLMSIAAENNKGVTVILPQGASPAVQYQEQFDVNGDYNCTIEPYPSVYEDFQINCYEWYDVNDTNPPRHNGNVLTYQDVVSVCDWINEQDRAGNFPDIGEQIVSIECNPFVPQLRYIDADTNTAGYFITVRIRYVNRLRERKSIPDEFAY